MHHLWHRQSWHTLEWTQNNGAGTSRHFLPRTHITITQTASVKCFIPLTLQLPVVYMTLPRCVTSFIFCCCHVEICLCLWLRLTFCLIAYNMCVWGCVCVCACLCDCVRISVWLAGVHVWVLVIVLYLHMSSFNTGSGGGIMLFAECSNCHTAFSGCCSFSVSVSLLCQIEYSIKQ